MIRKINCNNVTKIDIGCKTNKKDGCVGIDIKDFGQEVVWDVTQGLPFPDSSIEYVYCSHFIEHIENKDVSDFFLELYRVCKSGAEIEIKVPHSETIEAYYHNHLSLWNENRIRGIIKGFQHAYKFAIKGMARVGIELQVILVKC
jgi:predicted SAM-dependent methyltransferase